MKTPIALLAAAALLSACSSQPALRVADAEGVEAVSAIFMSCKKPFGLTQDCSALSGPKRKIEIDGQPFKVAGNESGTITVLFGRGGVNPSASSNLGYELAKRELEKRGFEIVKVTPIESAGTMFGYAIETDRPAYSIWQEFTTE